VLLEAAKEYESFLKSRIAEIAVHLFTGIGCVALSHEPVEPAEAMTSIQGAMGLTIDWLANVEEGEYIKRGIADPARPYTEFAAESVRMFRFPPVA